MQDSRRIFWPAIAGALLALTGLLVQFYVTFSSRQLPPLETVVRFFSFFTILTNTLVAGYFLVRSLRPGSAAGRWAARPEVGTALTVYIVVVGLVYQTALRGLVPLAGAGIVADNIIHGLVPLYMFGFWLLVVSQQPVQLRTVPYWLLYPAAYLAYTLLRGPFASFYPYPFVDVGVLGYRQVLVNSLLVLLALLVISGLLGAFANWRYRRNLPTVPR
ncbi:Pr6Pr family membrane protein [Microvirga sp. STR05]|uniref:Pr6Pr family membrane protein n=1 Tax=Hymenobacter duratus TaxID=2771356 RepID=A0ABR8JLA1_9BACT|nr:Pr6Pr family membrane protein [Hymenobacter duratus]MBD2716170.1 Pr6Pr family membrane protein [Hymenobacter duratus]MBR7951084.1 Pr6Pr family membrane protein [Microvirga sp. STR05]